MSKPYESYFPKPKETRLVQASIDAETADRVKAFLDKENLSWKDFLTGLMQKFLDDQKRKGA